MLDSSGATLTIAFACLAGLLMGSFLNVCIYRVPRDLSVVRPRSACPHCNAPIGAYDNIPLVSYLLLGRKCRTCGAAISWRYPAVELLTAVLFGLVAAQYGPTLAGLKWIIFEALQVVLLFTDLEVMILPDEFTLGGTGAGLILGAMVPVPGSLGALLVNGENQVGASLLNAGISALLLAGPLWFTAWAYGKLRRRDMLGLGDVKLLVLIGVYLGLEYGLLSLMAAAVLGSIAGVIWARIKGESIGTIELPFGSFLCATAALVPVLKPLQNL